MHPADRRIHGHRPIDTAFGVGHRHQLRQDGIPGVVAGEAAMPRPHRLPGAKISRQITPGDTTAIPVDDPLNHLTMTPKRRAPDTIRTHGNKGSITLHCASVNTASGVTPNTLTHNRRHIRETRPSQFPGQRAKQSIPWNSCPTERKSEPSTYPGARRRCKGNVVELDNNLEARWLEGMK